MANKKIFATRTATPPVPAADTLNAAGGLAYKMTSEAALAQYVVTSCFNNTFYASADEQLDRVRTLATEVSTPFLAKAAIYGHATAGMKDAPAFLLAMLAMRIKGPDGVLAARLFRRAFPRVITSGKMLCNFAQIVRSGVTGRRSFGTVAKEAVRSWFESRTGNQVYTSSVGVDSPSLADVIKMVRPHPEDDGKRALYGYLIGRPYEVESLPSKVRDLEVFKQAKRLGLASEVPDVPFQVLASLDLTADEWRQVVRNLPWNALRMNLNTAARHGVFDGAPGQEMVSYVAARLADPEEVRRSNTFPYQLLAAYENTPDAPPAVRNALQDAMEVATANVPSYGVPVAACVDVSGSMHHPVTGLRKGATSKVTCIQVASLIGATLARRNPETIILPFSDSVVPADINPRDSVITNAEKLSRLPSGGTNCGAPMQALLHPKYEFGRPKLIVYASDNQSWVGQSAFCGFISGYTRGTTLATAWASYKKLVPDAKLVLIDIAADATVQAPDNPDTLNVAGMGDGLWNVINRFVHNEGGDFVSTIQAVDI